MAEPATLHAITDTDKTDIAGLLLQGRRVSEVIAHGLTKTPGWRRPHVVALITERGWSLDSDGRIPRRFREQQIPPATPLPGQGPIELPRRPVAEFPPPGTVTEARPDAAKRLIEAGKAHEAAWIRGLAEKAQEAMGKLADALAGEAARAQARAELAQLDARREALLAKLAPPGKQKKATRAKRAPSDSDKPIEHGTWGGYLSHCHRGHPKEEIDAECHAARDRQMEKLHAKRATQAAAPAEDADHG